MKEKIAISVIVLLIGSIFYINYSHYDKKKPKDNSGKVKSAISYNINSNEFNLSEKVNKIPVKNNSYFEPDYIWANSYIVIDVDSGAILAQQNKDTSVPIASTTKIMTSIIALENYDLDEVVTVSQKAYNQIGSYSGIEIDEEISVKNLLYCLLIKSGNDAAYALAEHMGFDNFVNKMNEKAKYLNLNNTIFKDPAGLNDEGHSTAFDLATIARYAMLNKTFKEIVSTPNITVSSIDEAYTHELENSNRLIQPDEPLYYQFANGIKTGYTPDAGHCLVSAAIKDGHQIVAVVLHTYEDTNDASAKESKKILEWAFDNYKWN